MSLRRTLGVLVTVALATGSLVVGATGSVSAATDSRLSRFPYLTDLVGLNVTVNWATLRSPDAPDVTASTTGWVRWGTPTGGGGCTFAPGSAAATKKTMQIGPSVERPTATSEYQWSATVTVPSAGTWCYAPYISPPVTGQVDLLGGNYPTFQTQVATGANDSYSFAVLGDWGEVDQNGQNADLHNVLSHLAGSGVRFAVTTGDNAYNSGSQEDYGDLLQHVIPANPGNPSAVPPIPATPQTGMSAVFGSPFWGGVGSSIPLFATIGNHGLVRNDSACVVPANNTACHPHYMNWPQPTAVTSSGGRYQVTTYTTKFGATASIGDAWYAFNAGNTRFYVLTAAWPDNAWGSAPANVGGYANDYEAHWKPGAAEYQWLLADLAAHPTGLKFAFLHKPFTSDTSSAREASDPYLRSDTQQGGGAASLEALLATNHVAIAFSGHAHIYERNSPHAGGASLINYVTGGGGAQPESLGSLGACDSNDEYAIAWSPTNNAGTSCGAAPTPSSQSQVFHFLKVTVTGTHVTVTPTDENGNTFDVQSYDFGPQYTQLVGGAVTTPEGNSGTHALNIPVSLTKVNPSDAVTVNYSLAGSAVAGTDYIGATSGTLTIPSGQQTGFVTVQVKGNTVKQANRTVAVVLSNAQHAGIAGLGVAAGTIVDDDGAAGNPGAMSGGYVVDGFGTLHTVTTGTAHSLGAVRGAPHWGFDIARGVALLPNHTGGYVLDGFGGLHPFAVGNNPMPAAARGGPYWVNWDIAKGVAINPDGRGGYVVDAWGGLHPFAVGNNPIPARPSGASYWVNWNIVRGVALLANGGGYTVDGWGGLHPFKVNGATAPKASGGPYWHGWDIVRGLTSTPDGSAGFVLDGFGGAHPFKVTVTAPAAHLTAYWNGNDIARGIAL